MLHRHWLGFFFFLTLSLNAQTSPYGQAENFITSTKPIPSMNKYAGAISGVPPVYKPLAYLYEKQLDSISIIGKYKPKNQVLALIPYLDYTKNGIYILMGPRFGDLKEIRDAWPTFDVIIDLPDAAASLQQYCLNRQNPLQYRLSALVVLRYVSKDIFGTTAHAIDNDVKLSSPTVKTYLKHIEDGSYMFWGVRSLTEPFYENSSH